eukprot:6196474-Pleurochrysis_carterae.AAC.5
MGDLGGVRSGTDAAPPPAPPGDGGRPNRIPGAAAMGPSAETGGSGDGTESTGSLVSVGSNGRGGGDDGGDGGGHGGQVRLNVVGRYSSSGSLMFCAHARGKQQCLTNARPARSPRDAARARNKSTLFYLLTCTEQVKRGRVIHLLLLNAVNLVSCLLARSHLPFKIPLHDCS